MPAAPESPLSPNAPAAPEAPRGGEYMSYPLALVIESKLSHYENIETASWHVQLQMTEVTDIDFSNEYSMILDLNTKTSLTNWFYRMDEFGEDGELAPFPAGGITTHKSLARGDDKWVATVFYRLTSEQLTQLITNHPYLVRIRQSSDDGATWGDYLTWVVYA